MAPTTPTGVDISTTKIPIIDLSPVSGPWDQVDPSKLRDLAHQVGEAFSQVGFAYVINHGVDMAKVNAIHDKAFQFFQLPTQEKSKYRKTNPAECFHGYAGPGDERLNEKEKNSTELREFFDIWGPLQHKEEGFPKEVPGLKDLVDQVRPECHNVARKLLKASSIFLDLEDEDFFIKRHTFMDRPEVRTQSQFRVLHYYPMEPDDPSIPPNAIRCGEHADWGTITLLFQDEVGGLEVLNNRDGKWMEATPLEGSILVNVAQLFQLWSGGIFKAAVHRVRILNEERVRTKSRKSFVYFINPDGEEVVKCVVPVPPALPEFAEMTPKHAFNHYKYLIADATQNY